MRAKLNWSLASRRSPWRCFVMGEAQYRDWMVWRHQSLLRRKDELFEAERERRETEIRLARQREEKTRRDRLQKLLEDAAAYRQAEDIRQYVERVLSTVSDQAVGTAQEAVETWAAWARVQANALDPVKSGRFLRREEGPAGSGGL
jgi:hypothetical protein